MARQSGGAATSRRRDVEFDAIARDALLPDQQRISRPAASRSSRRGISM
ncbi:uncharacterized protein BCN122_III0054 [Burkholderia cenocepacia]|nr:uncharacterized protein BCN122_III0054 [Burkholderia cenocepacia]